MIILSLCLVGCGTIPPAKRIESPPRVTLESQHAFYKSIVQRGWDHWTVDPDECDALLFMSLTHVGLADTEAPIEEAELEPGRFARRPDVEQCSTTISRDMLTGLFLYIQHYRRLDMAERIWEYGQNHNWIMGTSKTVEGMAAVYLSPNMIGWLARIIYYLGSVDHPERKLPALYFDTPGYANHLNMLQIWGEAQLAGGIGRLELSLLEKIITASPKNALAQALYHKYTDGDQRVATGMLLSTYPADRLPTRGDWCEEWRPQRADGDSGFQSCTPPERQHSGGDFLFVSSIVLGHT